jgi:hypothetical protein
MSLEVNKIYFFNGSTEYAPGIEILIAIFLNVSPGGEEVIGTSVSLLGDIAPCF